MIATLKDHPRLRGEQLTFWVQITGGIGSPPLARGTGDGSASQTRQVGITPACAGNSARAMSQCERIQDHPRLRGEQLHSVRHGAGDKGSPPLARGTVALPISLYAVRRITPACAGNRMTYGKLGAPYRDHPRLRGEQRRQYPTP